MQFPQAAGIPPTKASRSPTNHQNKKQFFFEIGPILRQAGLKGCLGLGEPTAGCSFHKLQGFHPPRQAEFPPIIKTKKHLVLRKGLGFVQSRFEGIEAWRAHPSSKPKHNRFSRNRTDFAPNMFEGFEVWRAHCWM